MVTSVIQDKNFLELTADMRKSFWAAARNPGTDWAKNKHFRLYAAYWAGGTGPTEIRRARQTFRRSATLVVEEKTYPLAAVDECPMVKLLADRHDESVGVVVNLVLAYSAAEAKKVDRN